jgi:hypothetical protein
VGSGHGSSRDGVVGGVACVPCGSDASSWGRNKGTWASSGGGSLRGEIGHTVGAGGGSDSNNSSGRISWRVSSRAGWSRVSVGEDWDDSSGLPGVDDSIVEGVSLSTSP